MPWRKILLHRDLRDEPKPFLDHLEDLRRMVIRMAVALTSAMVVAFLFRSWIAGFIQRPLVDVDPTRLESLQSLGVADSMTVSLLLAFYAGMVLSLPLLLYFLAEFVMPALTARERRVVLAASAVGFGLFLVGAAFCYFAVLPMTLRFFFEDAQSMGWRPTWTVRDYYGFATQLILAFGLAFELPVVVLALVRMGVLSYRQMRTTRPYAVVAIFILAAIITPPDIFSMLVMAIPLLVLYEGCIWLSRSFEPPSLVEESAAP